MSRQLIALGLGVAIGYGTACGTSPSFSCKADDECTLAGKPGACFDGDCAYPDPMCPSGYSFPASSPSGHGGECATGMDDAADGGTGSAGSATGGGDMAGGDGVTSGSGGDTTGSLDAADDLPPPPDTGGPPDTGAVDTTGTMGTGTMGTGTTGTSACADMIGDDMASAAMVGSCLGSGVDSIEAGDVDWFHLGGGTCTSGDYSAGFSQGGMGAQICLYAACGDTDPMVTCLEGTPDSAAPGVSGCCGSDVVVATLGCANPDAVDLYVSVSAGADPSCQDYAFMVISGG